MVVCCFDKTGTLTGDTLVVQGVSGIPTSASGESQVVLDPNVLPADSAPWDTLQVLVACHSLVLLDDSTIGDPLEEVTLDAIQWNITNAHAVVSTTGKQSGVLSRNSELIIKNRRGVKVDPRDERSPSAVTL